MKHPRPFTFRSPSKNIAVQWTSDGRKVRKMHIETKTRVQCYGIRHTSKNYACALSHGAVTCVPCNDSKRSFEAGLGSKGPSSTHITLPILNSRRYGFVSVQCSIICAALPKLCSDPSDCHSTLNSHNNTPQSP